MIALLFAAYLTAAPAPTAALSPPFEGGEGGVPFVVRSADAVHEGAFTELDETWSVRVNKSLVAGGELVSLKRKNATLPISVPNNLLILANGDRLVLDAALVPELRDDRLLFRPATPLQLAQETASISVSLVSLLWFAGSERDNDPLLTLRRLHSQPGARDLILLGNGDQLEGTISGLDAKQGLRATVNQRDMTLPAHKLAAIAFNKELQTRLRTTGPVAHLVLANGTRVGVSKLRLSAGNRTLEGKTLFGVDCSIPLESLVSLQIRGGRAVYLSDLIPSRQEQQPFLGVSWPLARDSSVAGRDLLLAGSAYDKGLGMHAGTRVTFDLKGEYRWFEAVVGMDDVTGKRGQARFSIQVDGKVLETHGSKELCATDPPRVVRVSVLQAKELTLVTDFSETFGNVQAHVNWADARLVRSAP